MYGKIVRLGLASNFCYDISLRGKTGLKTQKKFKKSLFSKIVAGIKNVL